MARGQSIGSSIWGAPGAQATMRPRTTSNGNGMIDEAENQAPAENPLFVRNWLIALIILLAALYTLGRIL